LGDVTPNHVIVGQAEEARVIKLAANTLLAGTTQLLAEAVVMAGPDLTWSAAAW